jgi:hypothetical protein
VQVECSIAELGMAKQNLDSAHFRVGFKHVGHEAVSKQMGRNAPADAGAITRTLQKASDEM